MSEKKIVIVVRGGLVETVFGTSDADVSVTVLDTDRPAFETPEEQEAFDTMEEEIKQMESDSGWNRLY